MRARVLAAAFAGLLAFGVAQGCQSSNSLVGGACAPGYAECGGRCVDTTSDTSHCGGCSATCAQGIACISGICGGAIDASLDGSPGDGSKDGAPGDGSDLDGSGGDAGDACGPPPYVTPAACGACGIVCTAPNTQCREDASGNFVCLPPCVLPLVECSGLCVDLQTDPLNCGACGKFCPSNICTGGLCQGATPGDIVVFGHDYRQGFAGSSQVKLLTNAVFIPRSNPLRILSYEQFAEAAAVTNVKALIQSAAAGRTLNTTVTNSSASLAAATLAQSYDVIMIYDQRAGAPDALATIGATWAAPLLAFAQAGGVIIALDGGSGQEGMPSLLTAAALLDLPAHQAIPPGSLVGIVAPSDAVGSLVIGPYGAFPRSVTLLTNEPYAGDVTYVAEQIVSGVPSDPVVIHKIIN